MTPVFIDTSAIYAVLVADDAEHERARRILANLQGEDVTLVSTSFVVLESVALLQSRIGVPAVQAFNRLVLGALDIEWVEAVHYERAMLALPAANRRDVSLTDWTSFEVMRQRGIERAFAFDPHFAEQGFTLEG